MLPTVTPHPPYPGSETIHLSPHLEGVLATTGLLPVTHPHPPSPSSHPSLTLPSPSCSYFTLYPNGSLALNLVNQSLEGVYMCTASNPGGVATLSHDVDVKGAL